MPRLSPEELAQRAHGMGSTCVVEACGLAPWKGAGPMRLYCEKLGLKSPDDEDEIDDGWLEWGHVQEPVIADWYERERGVRILLGPQIRSAEYPFLWATLDRVTLGEERLVEVKNVGSPRLYSHWDTSSQDGIPRYVRAQVTLAMHYTAFRECDVVASIGGRPPHVWRVFYDKELAELLVGTGVAFWRRVERREPPPLDYTPATKEYLRARYPGDEDRVIADCEDPEVEVWGRRRAEIGGELTKLAAERERLDALILERIGARSGLQGDGWKMTWKLDANGKRRQRFTVRGAGHEQ